MNEIGEKLINAMKETFGNDNKRINRAVKVSRR
jgi:hypothetical protein